MLEVNEQPIISTKYGTVTDKRVKYFSKKGWFSGGSEEDIPIRHITSVRLETSRPIIRAIALLILSFIMFKIGSVLAVLGLFFLILSVLLFWGSPKVVVNTAGGDLRPASGLPWTKSAAKSFVQALRTQLFKQD